MLAMAVIANTIAGGQTRFHVPEDTAIRIRLDDTLTNTDSEVGDPFSATVVERGEYENAECTVTLPRSPLPAESKATPA